MHFENINRWFECANNDDFLNNDFNADFNHVELLSCRSSPDKILNARGKQLLGFCKFTGLRILNGRLFAAKSAAFTFNSTNGHSVIDYLLASSQLFHLVNSLTIELKPFSDHSSVNFSLRNGYSNFEHSQQLTDNDIVKYCKYGSQKSAIVL